MKRHLDRRRREFEVRDGEAVSPRLPEPKEGKTQESQQKRPPKTGAATEAARVIPVTPAVEEPLKDLEDGELPEG